MANKKAPELRFKGFTDDWEQRELGDVVKFYSGLTYSPDNVTEKGTLVLRSSNVKNGEIIDADNVYVRSDVVNSEDVEIGDIVVVVRNGSRNLIGKHALVREEKLNTVIGAFMTGVRAAVPTFTNALLDSSQFEIEISKNLGATINQITTGNFKKMQFNFPYRTEQEKIGSIFYEVDSIITLHQRKLKQLQVLKQAYLQQMFPSDTEKVPKLRFANFKSDWEQRKFENVIVSIQTGTNLLGSESNQGTPLIKMGNIQRGYFNLKKVEYLSGNEQVEEQNMANFGDFLFNTRNTLALVGKGATWFGNTDEYAFNSNIARFKFDGVNTTFFNYLYNTPQIIKQVRARAAGTTSVAAVYPKDLNSMKFWLPSLDEQQKIGVFFKLIDDTIALHQQKADSLKKLKRVFLHRMFI